MSRGRGGSNKKPSDDEAARLDRDKSHIRVDAARRDESIQAKILKALRSKGERVLQLFRQMDCDKSNSIDKAEFRQALAALEILGGVEDYDSLFESWDADRSGTLEYNELVAALSGRRYDTFEAFDTDLMKKGGRIGREALLAYQQAGRKEAAMATKLARAELVRSNEWLRARWRAATKAIGVALYLKRMAAEDSSSSSSESSDDEGGGGDEESGAAAAEPPAATPVSRWSLPPPLQRQATSSRRFKPPSEATTITTLAAAAAAKAATDRSLAATGFGKEEAMVAMRAKTKGLDHGLAAAATAAAERLNGFALTVHLSESAEVQLAAENELRAHGVDYEHICLEPEVLLPLITEMSFHRTIGASHHAIKRLPIPLFFGPTDEATADAARFAARPMALAYNAAEDFNTFVLPGAPPPKPAPAVGRAAAAVAHSAALKRLAKTRTKLEDAVALLLVAREDGDDVRWLADLPRGVTFHIMQRSGALQPELPDEVQTAAERNVGGDAYAMLSHLRSVALEMEAADRAKKGKERTAHVQLDRSQRDSSIQERIHAQLREQGKRVQDLFRSWDDDGSNSIEKAEFRAALIELKIQGTPADFDALFDVWDADGSGSLQYTELTAALSGARYDAFLDAPPAPPLPPLLICSPSNPFPHNPRFLDDVGILTTLATKAAGSPQAKRAFEKAGGEGNLGGSRPARNRAAATLLPPYTPLGLRRGGEEERLAGLAPCTDVPSWSRPEIHCDPSGGPQHRELLPVGQVWRKVFGTARP